MAKNQKEEYRSFATSSYKAVVIENGKQVVNEEASRAWVDGKLVHDKKINHLTVDSKEKKQITGKTKK